MWFDTMFIKETALTTTPSHKWGQSWKMLTLWLPTWNLQCQMRKSNHFSPLVVKLSARLLKSFYTQKEKLSLRFGNKFFFIRISSICSIFVWIVIHVLHPIIIIVCQCPCCNYFSLSLLKHDWNLWYTVVVLIIIFFP